VAGQERLVSSSLPGGSIQCLVASMPNVAGQERLVSARSEAARFTKNALLVVCRFFLLTVRRLSKIEGNAKFLRLKSDLKKRTLRRLVICLRPPPLLDFFYVVGKQFGGF
jgi:hypothetical protein